jgi:hypothetical protein
MNTRKIYIYIYMNTNEHQEEGVDEEVEVEGGEYVAGVVVVPDADLKRNDDGRIEEENPADEEHGCQRYAEK